MEGLRNFRTDARCRGPGGSEGERRGKSSCLEHRDDGAESTQICINPASVTMTTSGCSSGSVTSHPTTEGPMAFQSWDTFRTPNPDGKIVDVTR